MSEPLTATGRKVVAIHGASLLDDVIGIEIEARKTILDAARERLPRNEYDRAYLDGIAAARDRPGLDVERWIPPDERREVINIHPEAKQALIRLLMDDERFRGIGYSEFIMRTVRLAAQQREGAGE